MPKKYSSLVLIFLSWMLVTNACAQYSQVVSKSNCQAIAYSCYSRTLDISRIAVRAGDSICYSVEIAEQYTRRGRFPINRLRTNRTALISGGLLISQQRPLSSERRNNNLPSLGLGILVNPEVISVIISKHQAKPVISLFVKNKEEKSLKIDNLLIIKDAHKCAKRLTLFCTAKKHECIQLGMDLSSALGFMIESGDISITPAQNK